MSLPLHDRALAGSDGSLVRMTLDDLGKPSFGPQIVDSLIPQRALLPDEQFRFHFNMTKCIGCRSCEIACNEQNGNPTDIRWRRIGEIEGGSYPDTQRHYLSMGCNHCLDAECVKGCPVDAYTKDPVTGIVLHSADACIGCQYCVWNCPYSVPQFNPERGVVGKCDMCHGRLTDGLEPACVNACPEAAIEIEVVNMTAWRVDYAAAESPGMPAAGHTISTTRITLPSQSSAQLERVDTGRIRPEHAHLSLVFMTTLMQAVTGALAFTLLSHTASPLFLTLLLGITAVALNISVFHLGRPAYAWRALKMWKRSWLSREVLLFGLFFLTLTTATLIAWAGILPIPALQRLQPLATNSVLQNSLGTLATLLGIAGILASAYIYLVPARPSWNMLHTPIDFLLSALLLGTTLHPVLSSVIEALITHLPLLWQFTTATSQHNSTWPVAIATLLWLTNQITRLVRLHRSPLFEQRASATLLNLPDLRAALIACFGLVAATTVLAIVGNPVLACVAATLGILLARYLFFVSVVPLNMALTFTRGGTH